MQDALLSKINVKKGKIIHFCEIAFTFLEDFNYQKVSTGETLVSVQETSVSTEET